MTFDDIKNIQKDERSSGFVGSMRERLKAAKVPFVVAGAVAAIGMYDLVKQPAANAAEYQGTMQVASLLKNREQKFNERINYLLDKLTNIREEVRAEDGGEFYDNLLTKLDFTISFQTSELTKEILRTKKQTIINDMDEKVLRFYKYDANDFFTKKPGTYIEIPEICAARGERWCEPTVGLYVCIIDPNVEKKATVNGVTIPKANENIATMRIPVKYTSNSMGHEIVTTNVLIYENAMKYVHKFFEGQISKEELDAIITRVFEKGKKDRTAFDLLKKKGEAAGDRKKYANASMQYEKAVYFPEIKEEKKFNGKNYTFKYDNGLGFIIIDFPLD